MAGRQMNVSYHQEQGVAGQKAAGLRLSEIVRGETGCWWGESHSARDPHMRYMNNCGLRWQAASLQLATPQPPWPIKRH